MGLKLSKKGNVRIKFKLESWLLDLCDLNMGINSHSKASVEVLLLLYLLLAMLAKMVNGVQLVQI